MILCGFLLFLGCFGILDFMVVLWVVGDYRDAVLVCGVPRVYGFC